MSDNSMDPTSPSQLLQISTKPPQEQQATQKRHETGKARHAWTGRQCDEKGTTDGVVKKKRVNLHIPKIVIFFFPIIVFVGLGALYLLLRWLLL